jgi:catechol 2,3-dioxygenase-like lactoylglutathione lyase family enzyme
VPDRITRRSFLGSLAALAVAPATLARGDRPAAIPVHGLNHMTLAVADPGRSLEFYQGLFGMPIQARQGPTPCLQIGDGPQFMALAASGTGLKPGIHHFCMTVEGFDVERLMQRLDAHGVVRAESDVLASGISGGPLRARVRVRDESVGGAPEGTPELYLGDPDGIVVQLQDTSYCGGAGVLGSSCSTEPSPSGGRLRTRGINHFTVFVSDPERTIAFYQRVFGLPQTKMQGAMPLFDVGSAGQILGFVGGGDFVAEPFIHHTCLTVDDFQHERVLELLADYGVKTREDPIGGPIEPLSAYVTMRMPDRGGAPEGTPELYFTDPDGILIQLQDPRYCGGAGYFGEACARV